MKKIPYLLILLSGFGISLMAETRVSAMFTDNMILQRDMPVAVFGSGDEGAKISVEINGKQAETIVKGGLWSLKLPPSKAGGPYLLKISGKNTLEFKNVMFGDVWVCAGQSNMAGNVRYYSHSRYKDVGGAKFQKLLDESEKNKNVRLIGFNRTAVEKVLPDVDISKAYAASWQEPNAAALRDASALGYVFGTELQKELQVPIGLIAANRGATPIQTWMSDTALKGTPKTSLYRSVIAPLQKFTIKGVIWYQGENNARSVRGSMAYADQFKTLISSWRQEWNQGDFPFLFFQLSGYRDSAKHQPSINWPYLRESQTKALQLANTGMTVITDLGHPTDIHPHLKYDQALRMVPLALEKVYHRSQLGSGPEFKEVKISENKLVISFTRIGSGLVAQTIETPWLKVSSGKLQGFVICGKDKKFFKAEAVIEGNSVIVSSEKVKSPVAVRYSWAGLPEANLFNKEGFPAVPFRSDTFDHASVSWGFEVE
jgi:sialate O-acetylesterase